MFQRFYVPGTLLQEISNTKKFDPPVLHTISTADHGQAVCMVALGDMAKEAVEKLTGEKVTAKH